MSENTMYQIHIELLAFTPEIWRKIMVPSDILLADLHKVIQTTMGWTNSHLHQFIKADKMYTKRFSGDQFWGESGEIDYKGMRISDLLKAEKDELIYEYDFGDGWNHKLILEKILPVNQDQELPICIYGAMNCPPEDCGGPGGYQNLLEIIKQPTHEEYEETMTWLGGKFDPNYFNLEKVNKKLKQRNFGMK